VPYSEMYERFKLGNRPHPSGSQQQQEGRCQGTGSQGAAWTRELLDTVLYWYCTEHHPALHSAVLCCTVRPLLLYYDTALLYCIQSAFLCGTVILDGVVATLHLVRRFVY